VAIKNLRLQLEEFPMKTMTMPKMTRLALIALIITGLVALPALLRGQGAAQGAVQQVQHDPSRELAMKITQPFTFAAVGDIIIRRPVGEGEAGYQALVKVMREADMIYANMEGPMVLVCAGHKTPRTRV